MLFGSRVVTFLLVIQAEHVLPDVRHDLENAGTGGVGFIVAGDSLPDRDGAIAGLFQNAEYVRALRVVIPDLEPECAAADAFASACAAPAERELRANCGHHGLVVIEYGSFPPFRIFDWNDARIGLVPCNPVLRAQANPPFALEAPDHS